MFSEKIIVVEDDKQIRNFIVYALEQEGFEVLEAETGTSALQCVANNSVDLMLLDLGLPDIDGMSVLHKLNEWSDMPIIIISARDEDKEKVMALDAGADDYLTKPFSAVELLARIRVALRHYYRMNKEPERSILSNGDLCVDLERHLAQLKGKEIHFSPLEYQLVVLFLNNVDKVLTYHVIIQEVWGKGYGSDTQALRALMASIRRKIEDNPAKPVYISTEIGVGYRMNSL